MTSPDQLEQDLAQTRNDVSDDVARLNDKVSPASVVSRRTDKIKATASSIKDRLMGSSDSAGQAAGEKMSSAVGSVKDATDSAAAKLGDAAGSAPQALRGQASGNPIAAGLVAFGVGWLLASLVPASDVEEDVARRVEDNAGGVVGPLKQSAQDVADTMAQPIKDSAEALKQSATDATDKTSEHAKSAAADVKDDAQAQQQR